jgi:hypothetical protein
MFIVKQLFPHIGLSTPRCDGCRFREPLLAIFTNPMPISHDGLIGKYKSDLSEKQRRDPEHGLARGSMVQEPRVPHNDSL